MPTKIMLLPFAAPGHFLPFMELCKMLASKNLETTLVIPSNLTSYIPPSIVHHPLIRIAGIPPVPAPAQGPGPGPDPVFHQILEKLLSPGPEKLTRPVCAIVDVMLIGSANVFGKFGIPTVAFFTSGACSAAVELATWKARPLDLKPGETRFLPGLPDNVVVTHSDLNRGSHAPPLHEGGVDFPAPPGGPGMIKMGPPELGVETPWMEWVGEATMLMLNTCQDLERPFMDYIEKQTGKPVCGVGPLLPREQNWNLAGSVRVDREVRSSVTDDEVNQWLDSKPDGSVMYVSFGSEVGPTMEEYARLGAALESSGQQFILELRPGSGKPGPPRGTGSAVAVAEEGYLADGLDGRVGSRGLIIRGWAPHLPILSHPSIGGFLTHCGWNSTLEALGCGVPLLVRPFAGDQILNAKLVVAHLKVGYMVTDDLSGTVKEDDMVKGIGMLMGDKAMKRRAETLAAKVQHGFLGSSVAALDVLMDRLVLWKKEGEKEKE